MHIHRVKHGYSLYFVAVNLHIVKIFHGHTLVRVENIISEPLVIHIVDFYVIFKKRLNIVKCILLIQRNVVVAEKDIKIIVYRHHICL